jgi:hypothetical protein
MNYHFTDVEIPAILFKHRNWEDVNDVEQFGRRILTEREIYFASPNQFNDPFDGSLPFKFKKEQMTLENVLKKLIEFFTRSHSNIPPEDIIKMCLDRLKSAGFDSDKYWRDYHESFIKTVNDTFGLLSLTTRRDSILMWSHYSNSHQGYSVGLDTEVLFKSTPCQIWKVDYRNKFPEIDMFDKSPNDLIRIPCTKSEDWIYEDEVRILVYGARSKITVQLECIKQIILGCNMKQSNKEEILEIKRKSFQHAECFQTKINDEKFVLDFIPIS